MRNLKKFLALALAVMMVMSLMITANAASPTNFEDKNSISLDYQEAVNVLSALGIVKGWDDGKFHPAEPITRAEVAVMVYRIAANDAAGKKMPLFAGYSEFEDVTADWYDGAVSYCNDAGIIQGDGEGRFKPDRDVRGYEVLAMALRMLGYGKNGEFQGNGWQVSTLYYARQVGLLKNVSATVMSSPASREVVAEILFQALQADLVDYNLMQNYHARRTLLENNDVTREAYKDAIEDGRLELPLNLDLMYDNYDIVGKSPNLTFDAYGRPSVAWVTDDPDNAANEKTTCSDHGNTDGDAEKYIPNADLEDDDAIALSMAVTPMATYDNAVTECQVAKDVTGDKKVAWDVILEVLNGNSEANFDGTTGKTLVGKTHTLSVGAHSGDMDALHTSDKWIGATGRTTEIYDVRGYNVTDDTTVDTNGNKIPQSYVIVYVDTFLAEVKEITEAVKDPNDHVIKAATAKVKVGTDEIEVSLESAGNYSVGQLVLVQTANYGAATAIDNISAVAAGERVPETPADVHVVDAAAFPTAGTDCSLAGKAETKRVTIKATVGTRDGKMGIITDDGDTIYASNTFLANKSSAKSVLPEWYDVDDATKGITNSMIGRTFDLVLDQNGYIVGLKEVLTIESNVGVITGYDQFRVGTGKYLSAVEAYMADGSTKTFNVVNMTSGEVSKIGTATAFDTSAFGFFTSGAKADLAWSYSDGDGIYGNSGKLGIGSLVMFEQCKVEGVDAWYFADRSDASADKKFTDKDGDELTTTNVVGFELQTDTDSVKTGVAKCLDTTLTNSAADIAKQLDDKSVIFVAEPEYAYNTGKENEGDNTLKYNVHEGFKKMPTITAAAGSGTNDANNNILFQQLVNHPEYVLIYPQYSGTEYIIRNQETITVDDSYLVLSCGATYAGYAEYNVLKNGKADTLQVSNSNTTLNQKIETAMAAGNLITVTGRNSAGYVISADTVATLANAPISNDVAIANCGGVSGANTPKVTGASTVLFSENDGVINFYDGSNNMALTLADGCTIQLVNLGTGAVKDISMGVAKVYINKEGSTQAECDFTFELDQYGYVCSLYVIEK